MIAWIVFYAACIVISVTVGIALAVKLYPTDIVQVETTIIFEDEEKEKHNKENNKHSISSM